MKDQKLIILFEQNNIDKNIDILLKPRENITYNVYIIANNQNKKININVKHQAYSQATINVNSICLKQGHIDIKINNSVKANMTNCVIRQNITGLILDDDSYIEAFPTMQVENSLIDAQHSVNIGNINQEQLYYLMSRKLSKQQAVILLIKNMFNLVEEKQYQFILDNLEEKQL
ncbi:MAG: SufD family Fe-S cluster assembly protein [Mycoplasmataceae bacterium]|jgi:Fe-S cluster assembly scaffold protein SufB|nr:SufD family Fe-S cluster assembly protein [Mycoplasmataceae bacterium]